MRDEVMMIMKERDELRTVSWVTFDIFQRSVISSM